jgi:hypothetical protein
MQPARVKAITRDAFIYAGSVKNKSSAERFIKKIATRIKQ